MITLRKVKYAYRLPAAAVMSVSLSLAGALFLTGCDRQAEAAVPIPPPTESSEDYPWIGDYLDETGGKAILSIEKSELYGKEYYITVYVPSGEAAFSLWECDGNYDERLNAIVYSDCVRTDVDTGIIASGKRSDAQKSAASSDEKDSPVARVYRQEEDDDEAVASKLAYTDGTGMIFTSDDVLFWIDDKDSRGEDLRFRRMESSL